ncbi:hypothetical protein PI124_g15447 [Phytophthora idaei]|nr:hypothetical protein PI124_g15447 [Phytophthora idaei]
MFEKVKTDHLKPTSQQSSFSKTVSLKKNLALTAVTVLLVNVVVNGESYEGKRALRQAVIEVVEVEEDDDSECGSLEMAEE